MLSKLTDEQKATLTDVYDYWEKGTTPTTLGSYLKVYRGIATVDGQRWACFSTDNKTWWADYALPVR